MVPEVYFRLRYFGKADACFKHTVGRTEAFQATARVHSTGIEEEEISKNSVFQSLKRSIFLWIEKGNSER